MKKTLFIALILFCIESLHSFALLRYAPLLMKPVAQVIKPNNSLVFNQFQNRIEDSHKTLNAHLLNLFAKDVTRLDDKSKKTIAESKLNQNQILKAAQKQLDAHDYTLLQFAATQQDNFYDDLEKYWEILSGFWQKYALSFLQFQANFNNPFKSRQAIVQEGDKLSQDEIAFCENRKKMCAQGLKKFFKEEVKKQFCMGYAAPGGGYRAMILTSGYLAALEDLGLFDATTYLSAISGSTWFSMPWTFFKGSIRDYQQMLLQKIKANMFNPATAIFSSIDYISPDYLSNLVGVVWPKFIFNQQISSVDVYGSLLANVLIGKDVLTKNLTDQWDYIKKGEKPFSLYNTISALDISVENPTYYWNELSPLEIRNIDLKVSIPSYAFGCSFDKGKSQLISPLQSLGYLMGVFGSAYLVDLFDIKKICEALKKESENKGPDLAAEYLMAATVINLVNVLPVTVSTYRVFPTLINNYLQNIPSKAIAQPLKDASSLIYLDAGIVCNIPGLPLLRKNRNVEAIIVGDTFNNASNETPAELDRLFKLAKRDHHYDYKLVGDATPTISFYKDSENPQAPRIIYVNFVKDDDLISKGLKDPELKKIIDYGDLTKFDISCGLSYPGYYCSFLYFGYTEQEFKQLAAIAEFNIKANRDLIEKFLRDEFF